MENEINIAEILKDKPVGTKLHTPICGKVVFDKIERDLGHDTIFVTTPAQTHYTFMEDGKYERNGECLLFPSNEMRDWSKFAWKEGDVLVSNDKHKEVIFAGFADDTYTRFKAKHILVDEGYEGIEYSGDGVLQIQNYSLEAKDAAHCYINTIEERLGGKLNLKTLEVEKPKFKDGDILYIQSFDFEYIVIFCSHNPNSDYKDEYAAYVSLSNREICYEEIHDVVDFSNTKVIRIATKEEKKQLFDALANEGKRWNAETKQIEDIKPKWTPKPFDKIIVRSDSNDTWVASLFSHMKEGRYVAINCCEGWDECLPYNEETAKLIGTTKSLED